MSNPYREHSEQYSWADRNFRNGDRVVFVGPPDVRAGVGARVSP